MPEFTKMHYENVAAVLRLARENIYRGSYPFAEKESNKNRELMINGVDHAVFLFCHLFEDDNKNFSKEKFESKIYNGDDHASAET